MYYKLANNLLRSRRSLKLVFFSKRQDFYPGAKAQKLKFCPSPSVLLPRPPRYVIRHPLSYDMDLGAWTNCSRTPSRATLWRNWNSKFEICKSGRWSSSSILKPPNGRDAQVWSVVSIVKPWPCNLYCTFHFAIQFPMH